MARHLSFLPRLAVAAATGLALGLGAGPACADGETEAPARRWELVALPPLAVVPGEVLALPPRAPALTLRWRPSERSTLALSTDLDARRQDDLPAALRAAPRARDLELSASWLHGLSRGNLLRTQLDAQSSVALRLRGRGVGVYLSVKLGERE
jgi:hypothetical protein